MTFDKNTLIRWPEEKALERILVPYPDGESFFCINMNAKNAWPFARTRTELERAFQSGRLEFVTNDDAVSNYRNESGMTAAQTKRWEMAWDVLQEAIGPGMTIKYELYARETAAKEIKRISLVKKVNRTTVEKYLRRFWKRGMCRRALQPDLWKCGRAPRVNVGPNSRKCGTTDSITGEHVGLNKGEVHILIFEDTVKTYGSVKPDGTPGVATLEEAFETAKSAALKPHGRKKAFCESESDLPTFSQFRYWYYEKSKRSFGGFLARKGQKWASQNALAETGDQTKTAAGIGHIYQMDATVADIYLKEDGTDLPIGRPHIYMCIDVFSRLITGVHTTFAGANYNAVAETLRIAISSKADICSKLGVEFEPHWWPAQGVPQQLLCDRGNEFMCKQMDEVVRDLDLCVANAPAYSPIVKAIVERSFHSLNQRIIHCLPGTTFNLQEKQRYDAKKHAIVSFGKFKKALIESILLHNRHVLSKYELEPRMIADGVKVAVPCAIWRWASIGRSHISKVDPRALILALLPKRHATVTPGGFTLGGASYVIDDALTNERFQRKRCGKTSVLKEKVECRIVPSSMRHIYVVGESVEDTTIATFNGKDGFAEMSWDAWRSKEAHLRAASNAERHNQLLESMKHKAKLFDMLNGHQSSSNPVESTPLERTRAQENKERGKDAHEALAGTAQKKEAQHPPGASPTIPDPTWDAYAKETAESPSLNG